MTTANQPIDHIRLGVVQAAIWKNTDSEDRVRYNVTLERIYLDSEGKWQSTNSFGRDELLLLAKVADLANSRIFELQAADRESNTSDRDSEGSSSNVTQKAARAKARSGASR